MKKILFLILSILGIKQTVHAQNPISFKLESESAIEEMLSKIITLFESNNHAYLVNIWFENKGTIQIVHPAMMKVTFDKKREFGITTSLNFDSQEEKQNKFKEFSSYSSYLYYEVQGIPSFAKNYKKDNIRAKHEILEILYNLYDIEKRSVLEIEIYDQGSIEYIIPN